MAARPPIVPRRVSAATLARELDVSRQAIHDLVSRRVLSKDAEGLIDVEMAKIALFNRLRPSSKTAQALAGAAARPEPDATPAAVENSFYLAKTQRETAEARIAEMRLGEMAGQLLRRETTERAIFDAFRSLRDHAFAAPPRAAARLVDQHDVRHIESIIADELRRAFDGWEARMAERMAFTAPDRPEVEAA